MKMKSFQPIVLAAIFAGAAANDNENEPHVSPTATAIESKLAIAQTESQSELGTGTRTSHVHFQEQHGLLLLRKSGSGSPGGGGKLYKSGSGQRRLRADSHSKSGKSARSKSKQGNGSKSRKVVRFIAKPFPANGDVLKAAVRDYVTQECAAKKGKCFVAQQWGFPMNKWDVSQVTDMSGLFYDPQGLFEDFNEDITGWDTGSVTDMSFMFFEAREFNQNLTDWNVTKVEDMALMFKDAQSFNQDISKWKFDDIVRMTSMLDGAESFEQNLCAWGEQPAVQLTLTIGNAKNIFRDSGCKFQVTPQDEDGPFCASCNDNGTNTNTTSTPFLLCRQVPGRPGFGLEEFDASYSPVAEPVFSELTFKDAEDEGKEIIELVKDITDAGSSGAGAFDALKGVSAGFAGASGILAVVGHFVGKSESDPTQELIKEGFTQVYDAIKKLSDQVSDGFNQIRMDIADSVLDDLMSSLQAMHFAYQEMQDALNKTDLPSQIKKTYTDKYRAACNQPHHTPEDMFRQLYGFACGDNNINRSCDAGQGEGTGTCKFGVKKRQYMLDIYHDEKGKRIVTNVLGFGKWLMQAMLLAQFHYDTCLPADAASCNDPYKDPIRGEISLDMGLAFNETADNVENRIDCVIKEKFRGYLSGSGSGSVSDNPDEFFNEIVANQACFAEVTNDGDFGMNVNSCMAEKTRLKLDELFYDKKWTVVVYSARQDNGIDLGEKNVVKRCVSDGEGGNRFGCISSVEVSFEGQRGRYFHLMYRNEDEPFQKDLSLVPDAPRQPYDDIETLIMEHGFVENILFTGVDIFTFMNFQHLAWCWGHPLYPELGHEMVSKLPLAEDVMKKLSSEEGYIAFRLKSGIDRAVSGNAFSRVAFNEGILGGTSETITSRLTVLEPFSPQCDFPLAKDELPFPISLQPADDGIDLVY